MYLKSALSLFVFLLFMKTTDAQQLEYAKKITQELCSAKYAGRGYVNDGVNKAADFIEEEFKKMKLKKIGNTYFQEYSFSVNTHPYPIKCSLDNIALQVGNQFIVDAGSKRISGKFTLLHFNMKDSIEKILLYKKIEQGFSENEALVIHNANSRNAKVTDSCKAHKHIPALFIYTEEKKLTHTINTELDEFPSLIFIDSIIQNKDKLSIEAPNEFINKFTCKNIIGYVQGKRNDSFIVYSAHYDHLGMQGDALFPGASDNASGVSMILNLAQKLKLQKHSFFRFSKKQKPKYTTYFILFSGEEAGLLGSNYFTNNPTFDIQRIKMLVNIDIMGNAENGITVVNGEVYKKQFDLLSSINADKHFLPEVKIRGKAANSDHYFFSEKGIPSIFIYSMGGQGYYHDIYDKAEALQFTNYENMFKLLLEFGKRL